MQNSRVQNSGVQIRGVRRDSDLAEVYYRTDSQGIARNTLNIPMLGKRIDAFAVDTPYGRLKIINENIGHAQDSWDRNKFVSDKVYYYCHNGYYYTKIYSGYTYSGKRRDILKRLEQEARVLKSYHDGSIHEGSTYYSLAIRILETMRKERMTVPAEMLNEVRGGTSNSVPETRYDYKSNMRYDGTNIPFTSLGVQVVKNNGGFYTILNEHFYAPEKCWENNIFQGDNYAVFKLDMNIGAWVQISMWLNSLKVALQDMKYMLTGVYSNTNAKWHWEDWIHT